MSNKKKRNIILAVQLIITLVFGLSIYVGVNKKTSPIKVYTYAISSDEIGRKVGEKDIIAVEVPKSMVSKEYEVDSKNIIGKHIDRKVSKGQFVYKDHLVNKEDVDIFATMDLSKRRKISLPISLVEAFSGNIKKGDTVDLAYTGSGASEDSDFVYAKIFEQSVPVWSVNTGDGTVFKDKSQALIDGEMYEGDGLNDQVENGGDLQIITLSVTPSQYEEIKARSKAGEISFVGRYSESENEETLGFVMGDYEKIFSGEGFAETGKTSVYEDNFDEIKKETK